MDYTPQIGKDVFLRLDSSTIMYANSWEYTESCNMIEVTNLSSNGFKEFVPGDKTITGSVEGLMVKKSDTSMGYSFYDSKLRSGATATAVWKTSDTSLNSATVYISDVKVSNGGEGSPVTYSATLQGTGTFN